MFFIYLFISWLLGSFTSVEEVPSMFPFNSGVLVMILFAGKVFISSWVLKGIFTKYNIVDWQLPFFSILKQTSVSSVWTFLWRRQHSVVLLFLGKSITFFLWLLLGFFSSSFTMMWQGMAPPPPPFILLGICSTFWICGLMFFVNFGKSLPFSLHRVFPFNYFFNVCYCFFKSPSFIEVHLTYKTV